MRQRRGSVCGALRCRNVTFDILVAALGYPDLEQFERTRYTGQQIVEIVRKAAGELAYGLPAA